MPTAGGRGLERHSRTLAHPGVRTTRRRLPIENRGDAAAENLTWSVEVAPGENEPFISKDSDERVA